MATPPTLQDTTVPKYTPPLYLINSSTLAAEDFIRYFEDFYLSLEYISCAPTLVFDRLMANVIGSKTSLSSRQPLIPEQGSDCEKHIAALEEYHKENQILRSENLQLKEKLAETSTESSNTKIVIYRGPSIGTFYSGRYGTEYGTEKKISFSKPYTAPPGILVGFRKMMIYPDAVRSYIYSEATDIQKDGFKIKHSNNTNDYLCSTWLEVDPSDTDIQFGTFNTPEEDPADKPKNAISHDIVFLRAYNAPPQVVVWLTALEMSSGTDVKVYATNVTTTRFKLNIVTDPDTVLASATISWVACTADRPDICTGTFGNSNRSTSRRGYTRFKSARFVTSPRVLLVLNSFRTPGWGNTLLDICSPIIKPRGMTWDINTWVVHGKLSSVNVSFIALT